MAVLVALDGEDTTDQNLAVGAELADRFDEELVALHVMPQDRFENLRQSMGGDSWSPVGLSLYPTFSQLESGQPAAATQENPYTVDQAQDDARRVALSVARETLGDDAEVTAQGRVGEPVKQIVDEADRRDARYLVIGGRKRTPVGKAVFGSVTQSLLLNAERPVVTVPTADLDWEATTSTPVVAAVDRSARAERVVRVAWELADATGRPLHVVHAMGQSDFSELEPSGGKDDDAVRAAATEVAEEAAEGIADAFTGVGLVGEPSQQILDYAADQHAGYVVTAGRSRSPVGKVLFGSVTQSVLLAADRPVLTVLSEE